jgi:gelsolin
LVLDLHGTPVQYREVQGNESNHFLSYFPRFVCLSGGVSTGFHHVEDEPPLDIRKLYRITFTRSATRTSLVIREVPAEASSLVAGDAYVLDKGSKVLQYNCKGSVGQEKFKAAEFVQTLIQSRKQATLTVFGRYYLRTFRISL